MPPIVKDFVNWRLPGKPAESLAIYIPLAAENPSHLEIIPQLFLDIL